jgi:CheY-like chemotaxis protein
MGHNVLAAKNGQEAIVLYESNKPDLILMDIMMPVMNGLETTSKIRSLEKEGEHIPIILLTSITEEKDLQAGIAAGADDYLLKPVNAATLEAKIKSFLNRKP